jgi:hypothetical protein
MKKPKGVDCNHCKHWYWYADLCNAYSDEEVDDPMSPRDIDCDRYELKTESELDAGHYDPLPPPEIVELVLKFKENHELEETTK